MHQGIGGTIFTITDEQAQRLYAEFKVLFAHCSGECERNCNPVEARKIIEEIERANERELWRCYQCGQVTTINPDNINPAANAYCAYSRPDMSNIHRYKKYHEVKE